MHNNNCVVCVCVQNTEENYKNCNIWELYLGVKKHKMGYQVRATFVKSEVSNIITDRNKILNRRNAYFSRLLNSCTRDTEKERNTHNGGTDPGKECS